MSEWKFSRLLTARLFVACRASSEASSDPRAHSRSFSRPPAWAAPSGRAASPCMAALGAQVRGLLPMLPGNQLYIATSVTLHTLQMPVCALRFPPLSFSLSQTLDPSHLCPEQQRCTELVSTALLSALLLTLAVLTADGGNTATSAGGSSSSSSVSSGGGTSMTSSTVNGVTTTTQSSSTGGTPVHLLPAF